MRLDGIHHVTCITGDARQNVDFYTRVLGLRLVAKSVNQDDPTVYHLFYSDELGRPGSDITFFEYPGAARGEDGAGMIHRIVWRVASPEAVDFWEQRLEAEGLQTEREADRLRFADPEGLGHELAPYDGPDEPRSAEHPEVPPEFALQGFDGVRAYSARADQSGGLIERLMEGEARGDDTWEISGPRRHGWIAYDTPPGRGIPGAGTVHHVAWFSTNEDHPLWQERLTEAGVRVTPVIDRHYFHSIYYREPSGVLFEIADDGPGFTIDSPLEELGRNVILPPQFEPSRERIEAILTPLPDPRANWPARR